MVTRYLGFFVLLTFGVVIGILWSKPEQAIDTGQTAQAGPDPQPSPVVLQRTANLEAEVTQLKHRLALLERQISQGELETSEIPAPGDFPPQSATELPAFASRGEALPVVDGLIRAGLDAYTAEEIARKQSEVELRRLELRDNAIREGYMGTDRFREEITQLREQEVQIRDEIDEEAYDKYLYYTGQPNRIAVTSVLLGSAAEENGIQQGDVILRYENEPLYNGRDLRNATIQGERDERVNVTVQREDSLVTVSVPRGPLGVRLSPLVINPEEDQ